MGIELLTFEDRRVVRHGMVLNPLTERQRIIAPESEIGFIEKCLAAVPRGELPLYKEQLVLPSGELIDAGAYCRQAGISPLKFIIDYEVGVTKPGFSPQKVVMEPVSPGSRMFDAALAQYFVTNVRVEGVNVYALQVPNSKE